MDEEFREGSEAYLDYIPRSECPYTEEATKALWLAGWDAQEELFEWHAEDDLDWDLDEDDEENT